MLQLHLSDQQFYVLLLEFWWYVNYSQHHVVAGWQTYPTPPTCKLRINIDSGHAQYKQPKAEEDTGRIDALPEFTTTEDDT